MSDINNPTGNVTIYDEAGNAINIGTEETLLEIKTAIENGGQANYTTLIDSDVKDITYIGEAVPGTLTSQALWRIQKADTTDKNASYVKFAVGADFDNVWDNRASLTYS